MSIEDQSTPLNIRVSTDSDKRLFRMVRERLAEENNCAPEEIGHTELFRQLALYRLDNPQGVEIRLNGESDTLLKTLQQSDTEGADALVQMAKDAKKYRQRQRATSDGAKYTGGFDG